MNSAKYMGMDMKKKVIHAFNYAPRPKTGLDALKNNKE
jgi:hypothetical protein